MDSLRSGQDEVQQQEALMLKTLKKFGVRRIFVGTTDPSYTGGNPKVFLDAEDLTGTIPAEQFPVIMPVAHANVTASGILVIAEIAPGEFAIIGQLGNLSSGKPADGAYWFPQIIGLGSTETTLATAGRAIRVHCPVSFVFTKASIEVTTLQAGSNGRVKVYSSDGVLLWDSGNIATTSNAFLSSTPASSDPVAGLQLNAGQFYIIEYTNTDAAVAVTAMAITATSDNHANDLVAQIASSAANIVANIPVNGVQFPRIKLY